MKNSLPTMGIEPLTFRFRSECATTELRSLVSLDGIKVHLFFTCAIFRNLPAAHGRCSKIICRVFLSYNSCIVLLFDQIRSLLTVTSLQNVIYDSDLNLKKKNRSAIVM